MDALPIVRIAGLIYPAYNLFVIGIGVVAASPRGMNVGWVELRPRATRAYVRSSR
jgi:hypothetical protein